MVLKRYLEAAVRADLRRKMVFVAGPRQVGKTTLSLSITGTKKGYFNWDIPSHREAILKREMPLTRILSFDEIHKYKRWRNFLKGLYDERKSRQKILVTGSARLDFYRYGGDSLQGRYHFFRMHPFSIAELKLNTRKDFETLLTLGGFPEPFLSGSEVEAKRWSREYRSRLITDELTSLERVHDLGQLELLSLRLPDVVGSPLSINSLREDLDTSHKTVTRWIQLLERLYAIFRIPPFGAPKIRAVKKEQKHYHFDWTLISDPSLRFENLVAAHLLKHVQFESDAHGRDLELRYFRDIDGREVDFVLLENRKPVDLIECRFGDSSISPSLKYLKQRFPSANAWQLSATGTKDYRSMDQIRVCPALVLLKTLI